MGASLLDAVLAETLDPAYARAAAARARNPPRSRGRARAAVALTMAVAGVLVGITYQQAAASVQGREQVRAVLVDDIRRDSAVTDELADQLELLRTELSSARDELLEASAVGQRARTALERAERDAAAVAVRGPGLLVTLANADPTADEDPVGGGTAQEDLRGRVKDGDLQLVVNALWAAGAEAIGINGQRLGTATAIRFAGEAVLVDFRPVTNPYEITAIGDPDALAGEFLASPEVGALAAISQTFGLRFEYAAEEELTLSAGSIPQLDFARPEGSETPAPGTDPLPGG